MRTGSKGAWLWSIVGAVALMAGCHLSVPNEEVSIHVDKFRRPLYVRTSGYECTVFATRDGLLLTAKHCLDRHKPGENLDLSHGRVACIVDAHKQWDLAVLWDRSNWSSEELTLPTSSSTDPTITFVHYQLQKFKRGEMHLTGSMENVSFEGSEGPQSACPGDSGGPAFLGNDYRTVYGVISSDSAPGASCGSRTRFVNLSNSAVKKWIDDAWSAKRPCLTEHRPAQISK